MQVRLYALAPLAALGLALLLRQTQWPSPAAKVAINDLIGQKPSAILETSRASEARYQVSARLLMALAFSETRFRTLVEERGQRGWVRLPPWRPSRFFRADAALRLGFGPEVFQDPAAGLGVVAARLAALAGESPTTEPFASDPFERWRGALERWNGAVDPRVNSLYAEQVLALARAGFSGYDDQGRRIEILPEAVPAGAATSVGYKLPVDSRSDGFVGEPELPYVRSNPKAHRPLPDPPRNVRYIVIHAAQNTFATILDYFQWPTTKVSSHYMVRAHDGFAVQLVDERIVAFHDACFNEESIGIEHEGYVEDGRRWFSDAMYRASARLVRRIAERHGIPLDREHILGHDEAPDCSEHTDPGAAWDWDRYMGYVSGSLPDAAL